MIGAILGDNINYYLGKKFGKKWMKNGFWILKPTYFQAGHKFFQRHGGKSVFLGRFVPMVKEVTPFVAVIMKMNHGSFFTFNVLGGIGWAFEFLMFLIILFFFLLFVIQWAIKKYGEAFWQYLS